MDIRKKALIAASVLCVVAWVTAATGKEVRMWVDENGVTHFTDEQFAPHEAEAVELKKANGMDVPDTSVLDDGSGAANVVKLGQRADQRRGWRGSNYSNPRKGLGRQSRRR